VGLILVVDDHPDTCRLLARLLRRMGHEVVALDGGGAALEYLRGDRGRPDLVLLDVMMPGVNGLDVLRAVRADKRTDDLMVVMFTAAADPQVREEAIRLGATDFWLKGDLDFARLPEWIDCYVRRSPRRGGGGPEDVSAVAVATRLHDEPHAPTAAAAAAQHRTPLRLFRMLMHMPNGVWETVRLLTAPGPDEALDLAEGVRAAMALTDPACAAYPLCVQEVEPRPDGTTGE
jgi:CheY-like chemotaxis protein